MTPTQQLEYDKLQRELAQSTAFIVNIEHEIGAIMKKFSNGDFNSRASFREAKEALNKVKDLRIELKKEEKNSAKIREKLKQFS